MLLSDYRRILVCASRQTGKSSLCSCFCAMEFLSPESVACIVSPSERQSNELLRKITVGYHRLKGVPRLTLESATRLENEIGSRIVALPVRTLSGALAPVHCWLLRKPPEWTAR